MVKMDVFGRRDQIWPNLAKFGPPSQGHQNSGQNEVSNTSETQKLTEIWIKTFFSENVKKIMNFGGLVQSGRCRDPIFEFLSVQKASHNSVPLAKTVGEV